MSNKLSFKNLILAVSAITCLTSCGTIINGTMQDIPVATSPMGAAVHVNGVHAGFTPTRVILRRKQNHILSFSKPGYYDQSIPLRSVISGAIAGNIIAGGFIGMGVDAISGGGYRLTPEEVNVNLRPINERDDFGYQNHVIPGHRDSR